MELWSWLNNGRKYWNKTVNTLFNEVLGENEKWSFFKYIYTLLKYSWLKKVLFSIKNWKNFWSTQYTPCLNPRAGHFSNDFWFLYWRMILETKICILAVLVVTEELLKSFFRPWEMREYGEMCIYLSMYIHTSMIFPKCSYLYL